MELSLLLLEQIAAMVVMAFAGFVLGKTKILTGENSRVLSLACIYLVIPCSLSTPFKPSSTPQSSWPGGAFALALAYHVVFFGASALLSHTARPLSAGEQACAVYNNAGNLIIAVVQGALGSDYVIYTGAYLVVQNLLVWTHGQRLMGGTAKLSLKKVLLNPNILALLLGLLFFFARLRLPGFAGTAVSSLGGVWGRFPCWSMACCLPRPTLRPSCASARCCAPPFCGWSFSLCWPLRSPMRQAFCGARPTPRRC